MSNLRILMLVDSDNNFTEKLIGPQRKHYPYWADTEKIYSLLSKEYHMEKKCFSDLDLSKKYEKYYVIYMSSEDRGLFYKDFIEDILLKLVNDGAILIPEFNYFRAHHNKVYQEVLRAQFLDRDLNNIKSYVVSRKSEICFDKLMCYPYVVKASSGSGSRGVAIVHNKKELKKEVNRLSRVTYFDYEYTLLFSIRENRFICRIKEFYKRKIRCNLDYHNRPQPSAKKIIIQEYIPELLGDYKVLYFAEKYYVLRRENRKNDFRASGSGKFSFPSDIKQIEMILDFALKVVHELGVPMLSMDIGCNGKECFLLEFQCLNFGPYTIQYSDWYFFYDFEEKRWIKVKARSDLEIEIVRSIKFAVNQCKRIGGFPDENCHRG